MLRALERPGTGRLAGWVGPPASTDGCQAIRPGVGARCFATDETRTGAGGHEHPSRLAEESLCLVLHQPPDLATTVGGQRNLGLSRGCLPPNAHPRQPARRLLIMNQDADVEGVYMLRKP